MRFHEIGRILYRKSRCYFKCVVFAWWPGLLNPGRLATQVRLALERFDLRLKLGLALLRRLTQVFVLGLRVLGPLLGRSDFVVDGLEPLFQGAQSLGDRIDRD